MTTGTDFPPPPERPPALGGAFLGLAGDPSLAVATDPAANEQGQRVYYTNVVESQAPPYHTETDVAVLVSTDGGQSFGNMHYVNTAATGQDTDQTTNRKQPGLAL